MAHLICWASGLLQVIPGNEVVEEGPVIIAKGSNARLTVAMKTHGTFVDEFKAHYVPGTRDVPTEGREEGAVHHDRMTLVIAWHKKLPKALRNSIKG